MTFKYGDLVRYKKTGTLMAVDTILTVDISRNIMCSWFDDLNRPYRDVFAAFELDPEAE